MAWSAFDLVVAGLLATAVAFMYFRQSREATLAGPVPARGDADRQTSPSRSPLVGFYSRVARQAGFNPRDFLSTYWLAKAMLAIVFVLALLELAAATDRTPGVLWLAWMAVLGFFLPDVWLLLARRARRRKITIALTHFLDMLVALMLSGMGLEEAFRRAGRLGFPRRHPLAVEVELIGLELEAGQDPTVAFRNLAQRTGVPDALAIASALRLGTRVGASVRSTLQGQAELLWHAHVEETRRRINSSVFGATLGVLLCGFPIFFVLGIFPMIADVLELSRFLFGGSS